MSRTRGVIVHSYTALCAGCGNWRDIDAQQKTEAARFLRTWGWDWSVEHGWRCPGCTHREDSCEQCRADQWCAEYYRLMRVEWPE